MKNKLLLLVAACLLVACGGGGGSGDAVVPELVPLVPAEGVATPLALSADGSVVAGSVAAGTSTLHAFRWTAAGGFETLGALPDLPRSVANGISSDGAVVVGTSSGDGVSRAAFRWAAGALEALPPVDGELGCSAADVSGDGAMVVGTCGGYAPNVGYAWSAATGYVGVGRYGTGTSGQSSASAVSRDGSTIVGTGHAYLNGAMAWTATGTPTFIGKLAQDDKGGYGLAVSRDGGVVAGVSTSAAGISRMFRWTAAGGMQALEPVSTTGPGDWLGGMSGDGALVVGWALAWEPGNEVAVAWTAERGVRDLALMLWEDHGITLPAGWRLTQALAVSDDGRTIAGLGSDAAGRKQGWLVRLPR